MFKLPTTKRSYGWEAHSDPHLWVRSSRLAWQPHRRGMPTYLSFLHWDYPPPWWTYHHWSRGHEDMQGRWDSYWCWVWYWARSSHPWWIGASHDCRSTDHSSLHWVCTCYGSRRDPYEWSADRYSHWDSLLQSWQRQRALDPRHLWECDTNSSWSWSIQLALSTSLMGLCSIHRSFPLFSTALGACQGIQSPPQAHILILPV